MQHKNETEDKIPSGVIQKTKIHKCNMVIIALMICGIWLLNCILLVTMNK